MSTRLVTETARFYLGELAGRATLEEEALTSILYDIEQATMKWTWQNIRDTIRALRDSGERTDADIIALLLGENDG